MSIPQDIMAEAEQVGAAMDAEMSSALAAAAPQGKFSARALNALVAELNAILPMFGAPLYPEFAEDITVFPPEFVEQIMMLAGAAEQAGIDSGIDLSDIEDDRDLAKLAGVLKILAANEAFIAFLQTPVEEEVVEEVVEVAPEEEMIEEDLFAARM